MHRIVFTSMLLLFYIVTPLSTQDIDELSYYPLSIGNQWDYSSQSFDRTEKIIDTTSINGHLYYSLSTSPDQLVYWMREEENILYVLHSIDSTEFLLFDFNADTGTVWELPSGYGCSFGTEITLISKDNTIITPSDTFINCYYFKHKQFCADAGILDTWFSKGVGKVRWIEDNIAGSLLFDLDSVKIISNIKTENNIRSVESYKLHQNYPNPFNPSTTIEFTLPKYEFVELKVYNILGKEVATLVSKKLNQGNHTYTFDGSNLASGIYYYQLVAGDYREIKKMILIK
jgi:hypothetical protein